MKELIIANIESLPPLSQTIVELQRICARDDVSVKEVAEVIQTDPFLTASIIKSANAPLYGYTRTVNSVAQAVAIFGVYTAKPAENKVPGSIANHGVADGDSFINLVIELLDRFVDHLKNSVITAAA